MVLRLSLLLSIVSLGLHAEGENYDIVVYQDILNLSARVYDNYFSPEKSNKNFIKNLRFLTVNHNCLVHEIRDQSGNKIALEMLFIRQSVSSIGENQQMEKSLEYFFNTEYPDFSHVKKDIIFKEHMITITLTDRLKEVEDNIQNIIENGTI